MPRSIVRRADEVLHQLESSQQREEISKDLGAVADSTSDMQLSFFQLDDPVLAQVRDEIIGTDIDNLTPLQALTKLNDIRRILLGK